MVMWVGGTSYPQLRKAGADALTALAYRCIREAYGVEVVFVGLMPETSTSTSMMLASMPYTAALMVLKSMVNCGV